MQQPWIECAPLKGLDQWYKAAMGFGEFHLRMLFKPTQVGTGTSSGNFISPWRGSAEWATESWIVWSIGTDWKRLDYFNSLRRWFASDTSLNT
jgi:hypothetical protein